MFQLKIKYITDNGNTVRTISFATKTFDEAIELIKYYHDTNTDNAVLRVSMTYAGIKENAKESK